MKYREFENAESLLHESSAAQRLQQHWRGVIVDAEQYKPFDRIMIDSDGSVAALVEIKVRHYDLRFFVEHHYLLSLSKVKSLRAAAKLQRAVPLVMVVCSDHDFLLDLRDESGTSLKNLPMNDRWYDEQSNVTQIRNEWLVSFAGSRFLPISALSSVL